jgi:hypothetical protein
MSTSVIVKLTVQIPSPIVYFVHGILGVFNGGVKCNPEVGIDLDKPGASSMSFPVPQWGSTREYRAKDTVAVIGKPDWYRSLLADAQEIRSQALQRTPENLNAQFAIPEGASHGVRFTVVGANPLLAAAPTIDADLTVGLRKKAGGGIEFRVDGKHDGFPNYTLHINGKAAYSYDCVSADESPLALSPPMDKTASVGWKVLA